MDQIDSEIQTLLQRREQLELRKQQLLSDIDNSDLSNEEIQDYISSSVVVKTPTLVQNDKKWAGSDFPWTKELQKLASDYFNIKSFR